MTSEVPFFDLGALARTEAGELHSCLDEVLAGGYFVGGPIVESFERDFADYLGVAHVIGVANGLDALRLALEAHDIGAGDEVVVPAFTYYATWLAVAQIGAVPVPVDVERETGNIDPLLVRSAITPKTRAIIAVSLFGQAARLNELRSTADEAGLVLIEDCAQSHGAMYQSRMSGTVGHASGFSFYPTKNLGALGDAGAVATDDPEVAARVRSRRSYGQGESKYDHVETGWNSRLDPLQAAFLSLHLRKLPHWTARRQEIASMYREALADAPVSVVVGPSDVTNSVWHHFVLRAHDREGLRRHLAEARVSTDIHYPYSFAEVRPMQPYLRGRNVTDFPHALSLGQQVLSLPMGPWMTDKQVEMVASALNGVPRQLLAD